MIFWTIYIPLAALGFVLYFYFFGKIFQGKKDYLKINLSDELRPTKEEVRATYFNLIIFALAGLLTGYLSEQAIGSVYTEIAWEPVDIIYLLASFFIALGLHDLYFYLTHRLLHSSYLFKSVHSIHHKSHHSNAFSAFSFHPVEGIIQIGIVPLLAWLFPVHEGVLLLFTTFLLFMSVYGHSAYELRPNKPKIFNIFNTSLHHYQHHKYVRYNFGIYLNLWDRLFGSGYPKYEQSFEELKNRINRKEKQSHQA